MVAVTPSRILISAVVAVTPSSTLISATEADTAAPPTLSAVRFGEMAVVPFSRLSKLSRFVLSFVPHVSADAPTSGLTRLYVVVVVSAISLPIRSLCGSESA